MALSGTTTTQLNRNSVIAGAMRKFGALATGQTPSSEDYTNGTEALNNLIAEFQTMGMPLWARKEYTLVQVASQRAYTIGVSQANNTAFPLKIHQIFITDSDGGARQDLDEMAISDFNLLPTDSTGRPASFTYLPNINYGVLKLWPMPDATTVANDTLTIVYTAPHDEMNASTDSPFFPKEWNNALIYGLASLLAPEYGVPLADRNMLNKQAETHLEIAMDFGVENVSLMLQPEPRY